jgi:hypothetical protein
MFAIRFTIICLLLCQQAAAQPSNTQTFESQIGQTSLIELFTSEGCHSCPPADRWLSTLRDQPGLWQDFIPVAFHVDYWDYLGWPDPFASDVHSQRQRQYRQEGGIYSVYTPGFVVNGEEWRGWFKGDLEPPLQASKPGILSLRITNNQFYAAFAPTDKAANYALTIAVVGLGVTNRVARGENAGKTLHHDFVVDSLLQLDTAKGNEWIGELPRTSGYQETAIVAWVHERGRQKPIQAVGGLVY